MGGHTELYKFIWNECGLTLGSRAIHSSCSNRSPRSPCLPKSGLADRHRSVEGSPCLRGCCDSRGLWGPSCNKRAAGKAPRGYPGGCSAEAAPRPSSFLRSFLQQGAKEKWGTWHRYSCWTDLFLQFAPWLAFFLSFLWTLGGLSLSAGECFLLGGK